MNELRYNPLLDTYTIMAAGRNARPTLEDVCPFCPPHNGLPFDYQVMSYDNDFPVFNIDKQGTINENETYHTMHAYGKCEVILYSANHTKQLNNHTEDEIIKVLQHFQMRHEDLKSNAKIKYIYFFENKGEEVGVTIHHPHAQLYAYSFLPLKIKTELDQSKAYYIKNNVNLFDAIIAIEKKEDTRIVLETADFISLIPCFTDYPFGVFIISKAKNCLTFSDFTPAFFSQLAYHLNKITTAFEQVYQRPFPYMMCIHQAPVNYEDASNCGDFFRFHIEFYPPLRSATRLKYYASSEQGAWAAANPCDTNECAQLLKKYI